MNLLGGFHANKAQTLIPWMARGVLSRVSHSRIPCTAHRPCSLLEADRCHRPRTHDRSLPSLRPSSRMSRERLQFIQCLNYEQLDPVQHAHLRLTQDPEGFVKSRHAPLRLRPGSITSSRSVSSWGARCYYRLSASPSAACCVCSPGAASLTTSRVISRSSSCAISCGCWREVGACRCAVLAGLPQFVGI